MLLCALTSHRARDGRGSMAKKKLTARVVDAATEYQGFLSIRRYEIEVDRFDGGRQRIVRFIMERGHAVGVLAYDPAADCVVLVNEMRPGILVAGEEPFSDSLIAGMIDKNETALQAAVRETREEAGLELRDPRVIHRQAYVSPGGTSESVTLVVGTVTAPERESIHGNAAEDEDLRTTLLSARRLMNRVKSGAINDLKTITAAYWLNANQARPRR
jgi:ADP-ribose pyrophosphatase